MALDIPDIVLSALSTAWTQADSVLTALVANQGLTVAFDPTTDATTKTWGNTTSGKKGLVYDPRVEEISTGDLDAFVQGRVKRLLVRQSDFPRVFATDDEIVIASVVWSVKSVFADPTGKVVMIHLLR